MNMNMANFAGNIGFKISCQLRFRVFSIPRAIWKSETTCLKSRDFGSRVPVWCIGNPSSRVNFVAETALPVKTLKYCSYSDVSVPKVNGGENVHTTIAHCQNLNEIHPDSLFDDTEEGFDHIEEVGDGEELTFHEGGDSCQQDLMQIKKITSDVEESAIKLLAARALTAVELRKKLLGKRFSPNAVEAVINKFQRRGLINDRLYAETFSQSRWSMSSWGPRRIKQALFKKGVSQADAEKALEVVFKDNDCAGDMKSGIGLSKHSMNHLYAQASKQWLRGQNVPKETRKSRIVRWLQYRGFDWNVINFILKKLDRQDQNP